MGKKNAPDQTKSNVTELCARPAPQGVPTLCKDWEKSFFCDKVKGGFVGTSRFAALMNDYCFCSLWEEGDQRSRRLQSLSGQLAREVSSAEYDEAMARARAWVEFVYPKVQKAVRRRADTPEQAEELCGFGRIACGYINRKRKKMVSHVASVKAREKHVVRIAGLNLQALSAHPNDPANLPVADDWTICVDESYRGKDDQFETGGIGLMAAVVFPTDQPLPKITQFHCAEDHEEDKLVAADQALETILNHPACGVLVVPSAAYEVAMGWDDMLASLVNVVTRLLKFSPGEGHVRIQVLVEPHGDRQEKRDFDGFRLFCEHSLKETFPDRARRVRFSFAPLPKEPEASSNLTWNPYPDLVGNTCLCRKSDPTAEQRYMTSGWSGICHLNMNPNALAKILRTFDQAEPLSASSWSILLGNRRFGLVDGLTDRFGERAQTSVAEWCRYLGYLMEHVNSGEVDMRRLKVQVAWMERYMPTEGIPKRERLQWLTAKLALANHEGRIDGAEFSAMRREFDALSAELFDECAPDVCEATLHLAVAYTNAYAFDMALALIQSLRIPERKAAVSLANYGKLFSSQGQHFAFLGMWKEARESFREALDIFARLSDDWERGLNLDITRAYQATAAMDLCPSEAPGLLALYLLGDETLGTSSLVAEASCLATVLTQKFHHHILLRWLMVRPADDPVRQAYLAVQAKWASPPAGHPWELIEFYRALLLPAGAERSRHLELAWKLSVEEGGETVMVIAAVIAGSALALGEEGKWAVRLSKALDAVKELNGLDEEGRRQALIDQPVAKLPPLELAAKVLPFNFR